MSKYFVADIVETTILKIEKNKKAVLTTSQYALFQKLKSNRNV